MPHPYDIPADPKRLLADGRPTKEAIQRERRPLSPNRYSIFAHEGGAHYTVGIDLAIEHSSPVSKQNALAIQVSNPRLIDGLLRYDVIFEASADMLDKVQHRLENADFKVTGAPENGVVTITGTGGIASILNELAAANGPDGKPILSQPLEEDLAERFGRDLAAQARKPSDKRPTSPGRAG